MGFQLGPPLVSPGINFQQLSLLPPQKYSFKDFFLNGYLGENQRQAIQGQFSLTLHFSSISTLISKKNKKTKPKPLNHGRQEKLDSLSKIQVNTFSITNPEKSSKEWNLCNDNHITLNLIRISRDFIFCSSLIQHMHAKNNLKCFLLLKLFSSSDFTNDNGYFLLITKHYFSSELYRISNVQFPLFIHTFHWISIYWKGHSLDKLQMQIYVQPNQFRTKLQKDLKLISHTKSGLTAIKEARSYVKRSLNSSAVSSPTTHSPMQH